MFKKHVTAKVTTLVSLAVISGLASAADVDPAPIVQKLTDGVATVAALGTAALSLVVVIKLFKYVKGAL